MREGHDKTTTEMNDEISYSHLFMPIKIGDGIAGGLALETHGAALSRGDLAVLRHWTN